MTGLGIGLGLGHASRRRGDNVPTVLWGGSGTLIALNALQPFGFGASSAGAYTSTPYTNGGADATVMPDARLTAFQSQGINCIRMAVDPGPMLAAADDTALDTRIGEIIAGVARRTALGFKVIVDIHVLGPGQHPVTGWSNTDLIDGP